MKKFLAVAISLMMVLSLSAFAANLEIDIDSLATEATPWVGVHNGANFEGNTIQIMSAHHITPLGEIDLSKYSKVIIEYGTGTDSTYTSDNKINLTDADGNVLGSFTPSNSTGHWGLAIRSSEIDLSNVDYNGVVKLAYGLNGAGGMSVCGITFVEAGASGDAGDTPAAPSNPETSDAAIVVIAAVVLSLAGAVVCKKVRV